MDGYWREKYESQWSSKGERYESTASNNKSLSDDEHWSNTCANSESDPATRMAMACNSSSQQLRGRPRRLLLYELLLFSRSICNSCSTSYRACVPRCCLAVALTVAALQVNYSLILSSITKIHDYELHDHSVSALQICWRQSYMSMI